MCPACGGRHDRGERFCPDCGLPLVLAGEHDEPLSDARERARKVLPRYAGDRYGLDVQFDVELPSSDVA